MKRTVVIVVVAIALAGIAWALWPGSADDAPSPLADTGKPARTLAEQLADAERALEASDAGTGSLSGVVQDEGGLPAAGARVQVVAAGGHALNDATCGICGLGIMECTDLHTAHEVRDVVREGRGAPKVIAVTTTAADGTFHFQAVPQMGVELLAEQAGRFGRSGWEPGDEEVVVAISEPADVRVKVVASQGALAGVHATAVSLDSFRMVQAVTDGSGQLRFSGLDEGRGLWLWLEGPEGLLPVVTTVYSDLEETEILLSLKRALLVRTLLGGKPTETKVTVTSTGGHHPMVQATQGGSARFEALSGDDGFDVTAMNEKLVAPSRNVTLENELTVVDLELRAAARLLVTVVDESGAPVPHADVIASDPEGAGFHNDLVVDGAMVVLGPMGDGKVLIDVAAPGLRPWHRELELQPGDNPLEVVLKQGVRLRGVVLGPDDKPAPQAQIEVRGSGPAQPITNTEDDGTFELTFDEPGPQEVTASLPSMGRAIAMVQVPSESAIIRLEARGQLEVFVHEGKTPLLGAEVTVIAMAFEAPDAIGASTEDGKVRLSGFASGRYRVSVQQSGFLQRDNLEVVLTEGRVARLDVELDRGLSVTGVAVDANGTPVEGAGISTVPWTSTAVSDEDGKFELTTLDPKVPYEVVAATTLATSKPTKFTGPRALRLVLVAKPMLTGRVVDARTGEALRQFIVDSTLIESRDGTFSVPVDATDDGGKVQIGISADGYQSVDWEGALGAGADIGTIRLEKAKEIDGIVRDVAGRPVAAAIVTCDSSGDEVTTAYDGTFRIELTHLGPEMTLVASRGQQKGRAPVRMTGLNELVLEPATRVTGQVLDATGRAVAGPVSAREANGVDEIEVEAGSDGSFALEAAAGRWVFVTRASPSGQTFTISGKTQRVALGVPPGSCAVSVYSPSLPDALLLLPGDVAPSGELPSDRLATAEGAVLFDTMGSARTMRAVGFKCGVYTLVARWGGVQQLVRVQASSGTPLDLQLAAPPELAAQAGLH